VSYLFSYFSTEAETNTETLKINMKTNIVGNRYGPNAERTQKKRMIAGTKEHLGSWLKIQANRYIGFLALARLLDILGSGDGLLRQFSLTRSIIRLARLVMQNDRKTEIPY
jgi:hypothetical protein